MKSLALLALLALLAHFAVPIANASEPEVDDSQPEAHLTEVAPSLEDIRASLLESGVDLAEVDAIADQLMAIQTFERELDLQSGEVSLGNGIAELDLPGSFGYADPATTATLLELWGNPPGQETLGMLVPTDADLFGDSGWIVMISYSEDGFIDDSDAQSIDYNELLVEMQQGTAEAAKARREMGFSGLELVGWAAPPRYDANGKKLYWAKQLRDDSGADNLNYDIRVLGRRGVLEMSAIASMEQLDSVSTSMEEVLTFVNFTEGHRYMDFDPEIDKVAAYGIGALVAGKVAAKAGLLKGLLLLLVAGKKFILVGVVAVLGLFSSMKNRFKGTGTPE